MGHMEKHIQLVAFSEFEAIQSELGVNDAVMAVMIGYSSPSAISGWRVDGKVPLRALKAAKYAAIEQKRENRRMKLEGMANEPPAAPAPAPAPKGPAPKPAPAEAASIMVGKSLFVGVTFPPDDKAMADAWALMAERLGAQVLRGGV